MKKITPFLLALLLTGSAPMKQDCLTGQGNIFNATLIAETNVPFEVRGNIGCVGSSVDTGGQFSYATIWGDDPLTVEKDGLANGDRFTLFPFPMENDAIYIMRSATFDTTLSVLVDSLTSQLFSLSLAIDSVVTQRDSLQLYLDSLPDVAALQDRITFLEDDLAAANVQFGILFNFIRIIFDRLRN